MKKSLIALLLAATAAPAMAQSADDAGARDRAANEMARARESNRAERQQQRQERQVQRVERQQVRQPGFGQPDAGMRDREANRIAREQQVLQQQRGIDPRTYHRRDGRVQPGLTREQWSQLPADAGARDRVANQLSRQYPGIDLSRPADARRWRDGWRRDSRYDWRRWRDSNRWAFSVGNYYDPFGYGYRSYGYGYRMYPAYYSSRYWINDPYMYRLPPVYGPYRWVRYWDDALLVDIRTGMVVDAIRDFFW